MYRVPSEFYWPRRSATAMNRLIVQSEPTWCYRQRQQPIPAVRSWCCQELCSLSTFVSDFYERPQSEVIQKTLQTWLQEVLLLPESCYQLELLVATRHSTIGQLLQEAVGWPLPRYGPAPKSWCFYGPTSTSTSTSTQGRNHIFKVGGPVPWSRVLLPFYRKKIDRFTQFGAVGNIITHY